MENKDTGILLNENNIKIQRAYFKEMVRLKGINVIYRAPLPNKTYNGYGELFSYYQNPELVGCIFQEHPNQYTMKKLGWNAELQKQSSMIVVQYDLHDLQVGSLFVIPSGIDNSEGRVFKVVSLSTTMMFPASITCELVPVYKNNFETALFDHTNNNFNLLNNESEDD